MKKVKHQIFIIKYSQAILAICGEAFDKSTTQTTKKKLFFWKGDKMKHYSLIPRILIALIAVVIITIPVSAANNADKPTGGSTVVILPQDIIILLTDYSQYLSSGKTANTGFYSPQMLALLKDRNNYLNDFFE